MAFLPYSPTLHKDELLYSWVGRLALFNAVHDPRALMCMLFGSRNALLSIDLPCRLLELVKALSERLPYASVDELIEQGTLFPFHRPFLGIDRSEQAVQKILHGGGDLKVGLGIVANRFGAAGSLRFCSACMASEVNTWGYSIWHRSHNLPGVEVCTRHSVDLVVCSSPGRHSHKSAISMPPVMAENRSRQFSSRAKIRFARLCETVLLAGLPALDCRLRASLYCAKAASIGYANSGGKLDFGALARDIAERYDGFDGFVFEERIWATSANPMRWLGDLFLRPERSLHPICHVLLIDQLWSSIGNYKDAALGAQAGVTDHSPGCTRSSESKKKRPQFSEAILDTKWSCRAAAELSGLAITTVVQRRLKEGVSVSLRPKILTPGMRSLIQGELLAGRKAEEISEKMTVSPTSVYRIRSLMKPALEERRSAVFGRKRIHCRKEWIAAVDASNSVTAARLKNSAIYSWLYRNDREWLHLVNCPRRRMRHNQSPVDWARRDQNLCDGAKRYVMSQLFKKCRARLSLTSLMRPFNETMIRSNREKLPMFWLFVRRFEESVLQYQKLRIGQAVRTLKEECLPIDHWRVQRLAAIKKMHAEHLHYLNCQD
ncbi:TnsD family Tn7-like transposition protein [uncultured Herbaspirillum sp.]|uniref:TnsD family Tn7-like transposition protein n=1 Tax=uncultured Herbaspirillum sp. TaxID=160236 RepID=UPI002606215D|nr:TnsD family Tn7-like transposition protein [uncultured Herbaspirillum sp.]